MNSIVESGKTSTEAKCATGGDYVDRLVRRIRESAENESIFESKHGALLFEAANAIENLAKAKWQPIETAPKNGAEIDLWTTSFGRVVSGKWDGKSWVAWGYGEFDSDTWAPLKTIVTHWMPFPDAPNEKLSNPRSGLGAVDG